MRRTNRVSHRPTPAPSATQLCRVGSSMAAASHQFTNQIPVDKLPSLFAHLDKQITLSGTAASVSGGLAAWALQQILPFAQTGLVKAAVAALVVAPVLFFLHTAVLTKLHGGLARAAALHRELSEEQLDYLLATKLDGRGWLMRAPFLGAAFCLAFAASIYVGNLDTLTWAKPVDDQNASRSSPQPAAPSAYSPPLQR